jgi:hypothetical protein
MQKRNCPWRAASAALLLLGLAARAHAAQPPAPWTIQEYGQQYSLGYVNVDDRGLWNIRADNGDIFGNADQMFFTYQPLSGDGSIAAAILGQQGGDPEWAKTGVHIRGSDVDSAQAVDIHMTSKHGLEFTARPVAKQATTSYGGDKLYGARVFPTWLRLQREGDSFTPFVAYDGLAWTQVHSPVNIDGFPKDALAGLSAASHAKGKPVLGLFSPPAVTSGMNSPIVQVASGDGSVLLSWQPVANAVGYLVRRGAPDAPSFSADALTPAPIKETSISQSGLPNDKPVRYLVSAVFEQNGQLVEGYATAVSATPSANPANLTTSDINVEDTLLHGSLKFDAGTSLYTISGSGTNIGGTSDRLFFAFQAVKGDFFLSVRFPGGPTAKGSKIGLMVRESLDGPSRMLAFVRTGTTGADLEWRDETGGTASSARARLLTQYYTGPLYLDLVRRGNVFIPLFSTDGQHFAYASDPKTFAVPLADTLYVGLTVVSPDAGTITSGTFDNLQTGSIQ